MTLEAFDATGNPVDADSSVEVTSSNPAVAQLTRKLLVQRHLPSGESASFLYMVFDLSAPGTTTVRVRLGGVADSVVLSVSPLPPLGDALVVDSFTVVEYRATCAWACPYLVYAPILRLREPTGRSYAEAIAIEIKVSTVGIGPCSGLIHFAPGAADHLNRINSYLWSTPLLIVRPDGVPLLGDSAFARVIVRDAQGKLSRIEARGPILRPTEKPTLPEGWGNEEWVC